jgi:hypothetical protein
MGDIIEFPKGGRDGARREDREVLVGVANAILIEICRVHVEHRMEVGRLSGWLKAVEQFLVVEQELPRFVTEEHEAKLISFYTGVWRQVLKDKLGKRD